MQEDTTGLPAQRATLHRDRAGKLVYPAGMLVGFAGLRMERAGLWEDRIGLRVAAAGCRAGWVSIIGPSADRRKLYHAVGWWRSTEPPLPFQRLTVWNLQPLRNMGYRRKSKEAAVVEAMAGLGLLGGGLYFISPEFRSVAHLAFWVLAILGAFALTAGAAGRTSAWHRRQSALRRRRQRRLHTIAHLLISAFQLSKLPLSLFQFPAHTRSTS